jgi:hypothetical protein
MTPTIARLNAAGLSIELNCSRRRNPFFRKVDVMSEKRAATSDNKREVYLVGSIPFRDAREVFVEVTNRLGPLVRRVPDGETGPRLQWVSAREYLFSGDPRFERSSEVYERHNSMGSGKWYRYRLKDGNSTKNFTFQTLPDAQYAIDSYGVFRSLKDQGIIAEDRRLQMPLAPGISVCRRFAVLDQQWDLMHRYDDELFDQIRRMTEVIPAHELSIQWDLASAIFESLERGEPTRIVENFGHTPQELLKSFSDYAVNLGERVPAGVELLYHLCYGGNQHRHTIEPPDLSKVVAFANAVSSKISRTVELYHMPVPRDRSDDAYFRPLKDLELPNHTEICLGLIHMTDGLEGAEARMAAANRYLDRYSISTECGMSRRPLEQIKPLLDLHAAIARNAQKSAAH